MHERVLRVAFQRRAPLPLDELLPGKAVEKLLRPIAVDAAEPRHRPEPEHLAEHRSVLEERLLLAAEGVETSGDQPLDGFGQRQALSSRVLPLERDPGELLRVERVSACPLEQPGLHLGGQHGPSSRPWTSVAVSRSVSGDREMVVAFGFPPPQPGRRVRSSGLAVATTRMGTSVAQSIR